MIEAFGFFAVDRIEGFANVLSNSHLDEHLSLRWTIRVLVVGGR